MSFDLFVRVGGYWSKEDSYFGGEAHQIGSIECEGFGMRYLKSIVVDTLGYDDNMSMVSWFPPDSPMKKVDIVDDVMLGRAVHYAIGVGVLTLFIVRSDDPYVGRHKDMRGYILNDGDSEDDNEGESEGEEEQRRNDGGEEIGGTREEEIDENDGAREREHSDSEPEVEHKEHVISSSDSESEIGSKSRKRGVFTLGQEFISIDDFKKSLINYAVKKRRDLKFEKSDSRRVVAICSDKTCPWRISGSINSSSSRVVVRALQEEHNCTWKGKISLLTNSRIADLYIEDFRIHPHTSSNQLQQMLLRRNINVPDTKCERSRLKCLQKFDDEQSESFGRLFDYVEELKTTNPGSTVELEVRQTKFYRFYVCFNALKVGWRGACRRIIHIDGTFLKWRMNGMLLIACGRDPNEQMFPIAWAIVDVESKDNWIWFLEHLVEDLGLETGNGLTFASDQQKGLILAVQAVLPYAEHRMCARHVYSNWKKKYGGAVFEDLFWGAADAYYKAAFDRKMDELKKISVAAYEDLKINIGCPWSRAYFSEWSSCAAVENNLGESFNAAIRIARTKPVVQMLEEIRQKVMVGNEKKRVDADRCKGDYVPKVVALLDEQIELAKNCRPLSCGLGNYEVGYFRDSFVVKMRGVVACSCRMYLVSGIPCCHIVSALRQERNMENDPKHLLSPWFKLEKLKICYGTPMNPVNGMNLWAVTTNVKVNPPPFKTPPGRPPGKKRRREKGEKRAPGILSKRGIKIHCGNCGEEGHNKTHCTKAAASKLPKKAPGRPRVHAVPTPSQGQFIQPDASLPITRKRKRFASASNASTSNASSSMAEGSSQQSEDNPSISAALPKRGRGRPRQSRGLGYLLGVSSSQP